MLSSECHACPLEWRIVAKQQSCAEGQLDLTRFRHDDRVHIHMRSLGRLKRKVIGSENGESSQDSAVVERNEMSREFNRSSVSEEASCSLERQTKH